MQTRMCRLFRRPPRPTPPPPPARRLVCRLPRCYRCRRIGCAGAPPPSRSLTRYRAVVVRMRRRLYSWLHSWLHSWLYYSWLYYSWLYYSWLPCPRRHGSRWLRSRICFRIRSRRRVCSRLTRRRLMRRRLIRRRLMRRRLIRKRLIRRRLIRRRLRSRYRSGGRCGGPLMSPTSSALLANPMPVQAARGTAARTLPRQARPWLFEKKRHAR